MPEITGSRPVGERGRLLELAPGTGGAELFAALDGRRRELDLVEVIPGHSTVLVTGRRTRPDVDALRAVAAAWSAPPEAEGPEIVIHVVYDGPDLDAVSDALGLSVAELVARHTAPLYTAAFLGFAPGFAYLTGGDPALRPPRRAEPRTRVPAGSVAIAGEYSTVYPTPSPGGWHLIGRSEIALFDPGAEPPSTITPGARVRFQSR